MLAVDEDHEHPLRPQVLDEGLRHGPAVLLVEADGGGQRDRDEVRVRGRGQLGDVHAIGEAVDHPPSGLDRQTRLAAAPRAGQGDESGVTEQRGQLGQFPPSPDEAVAGLGEVVGDSHGRRGHGRCRGT